MLLSGMEPNPLHIALAILALAGIVLLLQRPRGLFTGGKRRLPKRFDVKDIASNDIPSSAKRPLDFLAAKLGSLGFQVADLPVRVPDLQSFSYRLLLVPFVHVEESTFFLMGIEQHLLPQSELMLHIITPLDGKRRVETTTLGVLETLVHPPDTVGLHIVLDADSVEEIWSHHRLELQKYQRAERQTVTPEDWRTHAAAAYDAWVQSAVRAQRLQLESNGRTYRVRGRPKSII
jgi:hypothetical protein